MYWGGGKVDYILIKWMKILMDIWYIMYLWENFNIKWGFNKGE